MIYKTKASPAAGLQGWRGHWLIRVLRTISFSFVILFLTACGASTENAIRPTPLLAATVTPQNSLATPILHKSVTPKIPEIKTPEPFPPLLKLSMFSATDGWGISEENGHLLRTGDGGSTWSDVTPTIPAQTYAAFFFDTRTAWVTSGNYAQPGSGKVFRTQDGGITWQNFPAPFTQGDITFINPDIGYAVADPICGAGSCVVRLYKTSDSGQSWSLLAINSPNGFENLPPSFPAGSIHIGSGDGFSFQNKNTIWFGGGGIATSQTAWLKVSRDEGKSWQEVRLPLPEQKPFSGGPVTMGLPQFITDQYGVFNAVYEGIGTGDPLVMAFYSSEDGGLTWKINPGLLRESSSWYRFDVFSIRGVAAQCGEVLCVSRDGLKTWQATPQSEKLNSTSDNIRLTFDFINSELGWTTAVRTDGGWTLYQTSDGGLTWVDKKPRIVALGH